MVVAAGGPAPQFFGPWVVRAAFVLAMFGWGVGFYGPPIYMHAVVQRTGWSLAWVSAAVTLHFLVGALVVANLPSLHRRFGLALTTAAGAAVTALGVLGWALAAAPWQLLVAVLLSGAGWVTMGAAAINAVIAPWYSRARPTALARAYNGASIGGVFAQVGLIAHLFSRLVPTSGAQSAGLLMGGATACAIVGRRPQRGVAPYHQRCAAPQRHLCRLRSAVAG